MKLQDAAKILNITGELTKEIVKTAYRKACSIYHPDKGGSLEMMQAVNEAYESLKDFEGGIESGVEGYADCLNDAINAVVDLPEVDVEICGAWVWVTGNTKPHKAIIKEAGYFWAKKKGAWFFRPDDWKSAGRGNWSLDKIRDEHGSQIVSGRSQKKVEAA